MHPIKIRMLRLGWQFVFVGVFAMVGGAVRAYNLPFVLAGLIVGMLILHWRWVWHSAAHWTVERQMPLEAFAGEPFEVRFWIRNHSRWMPAWLLRIDDRICRVEAAARRDWLGKTHDVLEAATDGRCGVGIVPRMRTASTGYRCTVSKRGRYDFTPLRVTTAAPLGLLSAETVDRQTVSLYVYPQRLPLQLNWQRNLRSRLGGGTTQGSASGVDSGNFFGIRGWQHGDSRRQIHWRTTARIDQLAVRQYEQQRRYDVGVVVDACLPGLARAGQKRGKQELDDRDLERIFGVAGSLLIALTGNPLNRVSLAVVGATTQTVVIGGGRREMLPAALRLLAETSAVANPNVAAGIQQLTLSGGRTRDLIVLSTRMADHALEHQPPGQLPLPQSLNGSQSFAWFSTADGTIGQLAALPTKPLSPSTPIAPTAGDVGDVGDVGEQVAPAAGQASLPAQHPLST